MKKFNPVKEAKKLELERKVDLKQVAIYPGTVCEDWVIREAIKLAIYNKDLPNINKYLVEVLDTPRREFPLWVELLAEYLLRLEILLRELESDDLH